MIGSPANFAQTGLDLLSYGVAATTSFFFPFRKGLRSHYVAQLDLELAV
jgi:hypothetical protein